jgi:NhaA family Na+:H+ antiporter
VSRQPGLIERFIAWEAAGSVALLAATVAALAWANSPWAETYQHLLHLSLGLSVAGQSYSLSLHHWINDGLMAVFFFVVGLEIKREVVLGQLSTWRGAVLPVAAAAGGIVAPALLYLVLNAGGPGARGWGVPMATDIAFALGVLALLGRRAPLGLKVFLTALAIADDLGAVVVISTYYTEQLSLAHLAAAAGLLGLLAVAGRFRLRIPGLYPALVGGVWLAVLLSGVHATVAGILVALLVPVRSHLEPEAFLVGVGGALDELRSAPLSRESLVLEEARLGQLERLHDAARSFLPPALTLEHALHPLTTWVILPLFALANAGVPLDGGVGDALRSPVAQGVVLGLVVGKPLGIAGACWLLVRVRWATLPPGLGLRHLLGAGMLGGIGFTMSIFVSGLAFPDGELEAAAKVGILLASALAGAAGFAFLRVALPLPQAELVAAGAKEA